jgi:hypothetical protein
MTDTSPVVDLGPLGVDTGGYLLVKLALAGLTSGARVEVIGTHADIGPHLRAWCTAAGHTFIGTTTSADDLRPPVHRVVVARGRHVGGRWHGAHVAGSPELGHVADTADPTWGLAVRGVWVEGGGPTPRFALDRKDEIWADDAVRLYDPAVAVPWDAARPTDPAIEQAVVQVMTYLVENEAAALVVPARFLGQVHPHFAEIQHLLAAQVADEARHAHVFARRAALEDHPPTLSTAGGRASLQTLLDEPDFAVASFLLGVLGEGTFLALLGFLERHAPDQCTRTIARLVRADEARHVAFGLAHLERHCARDPGLRIRLAAAVQRRHDDLRSTAGLNQEVHDSLVLLAAGATTPTAIADGWAAVQELQHDMHEGRQGRLVRLGFVTEEAAELAALHTRNFM